MSGDQTRQVMSDLAAGIVRARPWWTVTAAEQPVDGPPRAGFLTVRADLRNSAQRRELRIWFRWETSVDEAVALLDQLMGDPDIPNGIDLYAWECRRGVRPIRRHGST